ncbi:MAG: phosphate acyltransferase [Elusimicrobiota bacterium]
MEIDKIKKRTLNSGVRLVFPEGGDKRVRQAADIVERETYAEATVLDSEKNSLEKAAAMVAEGRCDAMVAGASYTTAQVFKSAFKNIGLNERRSLVSSFFLMESKNRQIGEAGSFLFADCAIVPDPDEKQLVDIACATAEAAENIMGWKARVAFLSFSTKGSTSHSMTRKVVSAVDRLRRENVGFDFDGELQLDAAIVPDVAQKKDPEGGIKGKANVLIFPDLNSGNIAYKIAQRIGGMRATGPILKGFRKPVNDLSRGCSVEDIVSVSCFTALEVLSQKT